jgi:hypothetical protein
MDNLFTVVAGWCKDTRHVEMNRELTISDFEIEESGIDWTACSSSWFKRVTLKLKEGVLAEAEVIWGAGMEKAWHPRSDIPTGSTRYIKVDVDFRGVRKDSTREAKKVAGLEELNKQWSEQYDALLLGGVEDINLGFRRLCESDNLAYKVSHFALMTTNADQWSGLDDEAGCNALIEARKEAILKVGVLDKEIQKKRCAEMLRAFEVGNWVIAMDKCKPITLHSDVRADVKKAYEDNEAFKTHSRRPF